MENFFRSQREQLDTTQRALAIAIGVTEKAIANWENDVVVPKTPIAILASVYGVSEQKMEREVMAQRRRIEAKRELTPTK
jgi:DNA-binding XRE family transcriptional regulator